LLLNDGEGIHDVIQRLRFVLDFKLGHFAFLSD